MKSPFGMKLEVTSSKMKTKPGKRYNYEITGGNYMKMSVNYNKAFPKGDNGKMLYVGRDFEELNESEQLEVMSFPDPEYNGKKLPRTSPRVTFSLMEPTTGADLMYGLDFKLQQNGSPGKDMLAVIEKMTGEVITIGDIVDIDKYFKIGTKFSAKAKEGKTGFDDIEHDSILPFGVVSSDGAAAQSATLGELSGIAKKLWNLMVEEKAELNGTPIGEMINGHIKRWESAGKLPSGEGMGAWIEVKKAKPDCYDQSTKNFTIQ